MLAAVLLAADVADAATWYCKSKDRQLTYLVRVARCGKDPRMDPEIQRALDSIEEVPKEED